MASIRCLRPDVKAQLVKLTGDPRIHSVPECEDGSAIGFHRGRGGGGGAKRAPSAYNVFMGQCVKAKGNGRPVQERFSECVVEWKAKKR